ncbi:MAG: hypothetical protein P8188_14740 [Gemmatimonadota bacterium]
MLVAAILLGGCVATPEPVPEPVPPSELAALEARLGANPDDPELQALAGASLLIAGRCDDLAALASQVEATAEEAWPVLARGRCLERQGELDGAVALYRDYLERFDAGAGVPPVRGRLLLARRRAAFPAARRRVADPSPAEASPSTVLILPFRVLGDDPLTPVGRSLAARMAATLAELEGLDVVDPLELRLVTAQLERTGDLDSDATRAGVLARTLGAGQVVRGSLYLDDGTLNRLSTEIVSVDGRVRAGGRVEGPLTALPRLEKELTLATAEALGREVTLEERNRILYGTPRDLPSLLAYAEGLDLQDRGEYQAAAERFAEAWRLDPDFEGARRALEANAAAAVMDRAEPGNVLAVEPAVSASLQAALEPDGGVDALLLAIRAGTSDVSATQGERVTGVVAATAQDGSVGSIQNLGSPTVLTASQLTGIIRILVVVPGG